MIIPKYFTDNIGENQGIVDIEFSDVTHDCLCNIKTLDFVINNREYKWKGVWGELKYRMDSRYHEWFIFRYPQLIDRVVDLSNDLKEQYSHLRMIGKFGMFND